MEEELTCFEVHTVYKSGKSRTQTIVSKDEESLWKWYDKHYNADKVADATIVDAWPF